MSEQKKYVYFFGAGQTEGNANMRELLGGKGANLAEMAGLGLPVPQGFTISTEACTRYYDDGKVIGQDIMTQVMEYIDKLEKSAGKKFGDAKNPLLVSVRSGARASMPGMMDTILNLGLNETVVESLAAQTKNPRWAWDCYRRFIQMFSDVVMEVGKKYFEKLIDEMKAKKGVKLDVELTADDLKELAGQFKAEYKSKIGKDFPSDAKEQLFEAIKAVFRSWDNPRANVYRRDNDIPYSWGTAVNVQMMAFGNLNDESGTGVAFTRDPATGEKKLMGEFLMNAQGEDVVAGVRTPMPIAKMAEVMPEVFKQFQDICAKLEGHYRDMQDMEFTIENKKLFMLQTRNGKRTAKAALKIACDLRHSAPPAVRRRRAQARQGDGPRPRGVARRGMRAHRFHGRGREGVEGARREGRSRAPRNLSGGHRGHEGRRRHPYRPRRHDEPRRCCGARHGRVLRLGLPGYRHGRGEQEVHPRRKGLQGG